MTAASSRGLATRPRAHFASSLSKLWRRQLLPGQTTRDCPYLLRRAHLNQSQGEKHRGMGENLHWWTRPAQGAARRPATIRRCAWRRERWSGWNLGYLSDAAEGEAPWTTERDLRQRSCPPGRGSQGVPAGARSGAAADEPAGLQPGFQRRCGHLGLVERGEHREQMPGNQGKGAGESQPFPLSTVPPIRKKEKVKRRCRTTLQSRAQAFLRDSQPDSQHPANVHPTLALV